MSSKQDIKQVLTEFTLKKMFKHLKLWKDIFERPEKLYNCKLYYFLSFFSQYSVFIVKNWAISLFDSFKLHPYNQTKANQIIIIHMQTIHIIKYSTLSWLYHTSLRAIFIENMKYGDCHFFSFLNNCYP